MTRWEERILRAIAERYPASAAASGGHPLRVRAAALFPEFGEARADERESFLEAAEALERDGLVSLVWERRRERESLGAVVLANPDALYARLGTVSPSDACALAREAASEAAETAAAEVSSADAARSAGAPFFRWLAERLSPSDAANGADAWFVASLSRLLSALAARNGCAGLAPRALSVELFSDSKEIERLLPVAERLFGRAKSADVAVPDVAPLVRRFPDTLVAGALRFRLPDGSILDNGAGVILGFPLPAAARVRSIESVSGRGGPPRVLGVENKETFHALAQHAASGGLTGFEALLYVGGHVNPAVASMFAAFSRSAFGLYHAGDLDPDGILILQELIDAAERPVAPVMMDAATFDRYFAYSRELEGSMLSRAAMIRDGTRSLPGIEGLLERILSTGRGLEQEILPLAAAGVAQSR